MLFPIEWRGKRDAKLVEVTGVSGAKFCHNAGFLLVAETKDALLKLLTLIIK
jgi:uncharacterized UPF0160 family protein